VEVSVCARTCLQADVAAKTALLLGYAGPEWLDRHGLPGRLRAESGEIVRTATWPGQSVPETACI
jgi:thiamine biosynthesis lipoprotein ApbE